MVLLLVQLDNGTLDNHHYATFQGSHCTGAHFGGQAFGCQHPLGFQIHNRALHLGLGRGLHRVVGPSLYLRVHRTLDVDHPFCLDIDVATGVDIDVLLGRNADAVGLSVDDYLVLLRLVPDQNLLLTAGVVENNNVSTAGFDDPLGDLAKRLATEIAERNSRLHALHPQTSRL